MRRSVEIELNPVYMAEARRRYGDLDARISEIIGWVLFRVAIAQGRAELRTAFDELRHTPPHVSGMRCNKTGRYMYLGTLGCSSGD